MSDARVLMYAEDPGAANFVAPLVFALARLGLATTLFAEGSAARHLEACAVPFASPDTLDLTSEDAAALVVGSSETIDSRAHVLVAEARLRGVPSVGVVDAPSNAALRFRGRASAPLAHVPDRLLVADAATAQAYVALGFPRRRIHAVGHPHYDQVRAQTERLAARGRAALRAAHFPDAPAARPIVLFLAELSDGLDRTAFRRSADYGLAGWGDDDGRTHIVLQEVLDALAGIDPAPWAVLRLHPKNAPEEFARYNDRIVVQARSAPALESVYAADLVIGMTTQLLAEAAILGRPVLAVVPRADERAWLPALIGPQLPCVTRRSELRDAIVAWIGAPAPLVLPEAGAGARAARVIAAAINVAGRAAAC